MVEIVGSFANLLSSQYGLKNNNRLTRFCGPMKKKSIRCCHCQSDIGFPSVLCLTISRSAFVLSCIWLNNHNSGVNRHLQFYLFPKDSEMCHVWVRILTLKYSMGVIVKWVICMVHFWVFWKWTKLQVPVWHTWLKDAWPLRWWVSKECRNKYKSYINRWQARL